jgi:hypothetical protein
VTEPRTEPRDGYARPKPDTIPRSTAWPAGLALAITFVAWGLVTSPVMIGIGVVLFAVSLGGWIGEIRHEGRQH